MGFNVNVVDLKNVGFTKVSGIGVRFLDGKTAKNNLILGCSAIYSRDCMYIFSKRAEMT